MGKGRILIVEDELVIAEDLVMSLQATGYEVVATASCGEEAITKSRESSPDLIIMDVKLNGPIDGIQVARTIKAEIDIPVVFLTGYTRNSLKEEDDCKRLGTCVAKPIAEDELYAVIDIALKNGRGTQNDT
jgi:CheY-like chemotaxis protein